MVSNKLRYVLLIAVAGLLAILYDQYIIGIIFITILTLPALLFAILCYTYSYISAQLISATHVSNKEDRVSVSVKLSNPTIFPISNLVIYLTYRNAYSKRTFKKQFSVSIDQKSEITVVINLLSEHTGNIIINLKGIRIFDYFKLFSLKKKITGEINVAVLPMMYEIEENLIAQQHKMLVESDWYSTVKSGDDPSEVFAIREYREGDRPQRIHWKLTMKQDQLMIKDFSDPLNCAILIFINLSVPQGAKEELSYMDALLESTLSLSYTFLKKKQFHYMTWYDRVREECVRVRIVQEKDLFEAMAGLLNAQPYDEKVDALQRYLAEHPNDLFSDLIYISTDMSQQTIDGIELIRAHHKQLVFISNYKYRHDSNNEDFLYNETKNMLTEMGIGFHTIDTEHVKQDLEKL